MDREFGFLLNGFRAANGLAPLALVPTVTAVAQAHAEDLARREVLTHGSGPNNSDTAANRLEAAGYAWGFSAENVAFGQRNLQEVMAAWDGSVGHRETMLAEMATHYGFGGARNHIGPYWVLVLAAPL